MRIPDLTRRHQIGMTTALLVAALAACDRPTVPVEKDGTTMPVGPSRLYADCSDDPTACPDDPDYWGGGDGGDSWDTFDYDGSGYYGDVYADEHDDLDSCRVNENCTIRDPNQADLDDINMALDMLSSGDTFCAQIYSTLVDLASANVVKFFDNYVPRPNGYLAGDAHPPNAPNDPYAGQLHVYDNGRSEQAIVHTLVHEAAHFWGAPDGTPVNTTNPWDMTADQIATYCVG